MSSSSSDSSSDDDCNIYTNAAFKLTALNKEKKTKPIKRARLSEDVTNTNETEREDLITPPITIEEPVLASKTVEQIKESVQVIDSGDEDPVACTDDVECELVSISMPTGRTTRNSRKRNATEPEVHYSGNLNDSIEEEWNRSYDDSFNMSQEDNDNCVMIGSPEMKRSNSDNTTVTVKIMWKSDQCHRFELEMNETFQKVFKSLSNLEGISEDQVLITKKDKRLTPFDTPASIEWSILDILDGGVVSADLAKKHKGNQGHNDDESQDGCKIKIQTSDKRTLTVILKQDEPFSKLLKQCAEELSIPESKIKLYFDGDQIELGDTPDSLDLEDEACIDCKISK